jgi:hypothetical protein
VSPFLGPLRINPFRVKRGSIETFTTCTSGPISHILYADWGWVSKARQTALQTTLSAPSHTSRMLNIPCGKPPEIAVQKQGRVVDQSSLLHTLIGNHTRTLDSRSQLTPNSQVIHRDFGFPNTAPATVTRANTVTCVDQTVTSPQNQEALIKTMINFLSRGRGGSHGQLSRITTSEMSS